jgi:hypothetical protein
MKVDFVYFSVHEFKKGDNNSLENEKREKNSSVQHISMKKRMILVSLGSIR